MLQAFDAPVMETNCELRPSSTVATQSLMLMNGDFILEQAKMLATDLVSKPLVTANLTASSIDLSGLPEMKTKQEPAWQMGYGAIDEGTGRIANFTRLPHFEAGTWQGSATRPDPQIGWVLLNAAGGHTGKNPDFAAIRRWTAPLSGTVEIKGSLHHPSENGDGVRSRIVSSRTGIAGDWTALNAQVDTSIAAIEVAAGDTIDFVTDCRTNETSDSFAWGIEILLTQPDGYVATWKSDQGFTGPQATAVELSPSHLIQAWQKAYCRPPSRQELEIAIDFINQQCLEMAVRPRTLPEGVSPPQQALINLCQALLTSNEFLYVQ
jgi:hypothetical protein